MGHNNDHAGAGHTAMAVGSVRLRVPHSGELPLLALSCEGGEAAAGRKRPPSCKMCRLTDAMAPPSIHY